MVWAGLSIIALVISVSSDISKMEHRSTSFRPLAHIGFNNSLAKILDNIDSVLQILRYEFQCNDGIPFLMLLDMTIRKMGCNFIYTCRKVEKTSLTRNLWTENIPMGIYYISIYDRIQGFMSLFRFLEPLICSSVRTKRISI